MEIIPHYIDFYFNVAHTDQFRSVLRRYVKLKCFIQNQQSLQKFEFDFTQKHNGDVFMVLNLIKYIHETQEEKLLHNT